MFGYFKRWGSFEYVYKKTGQYGRPLLTLAVMMLIAGLVWGLYLAPPDYQQSDAYRLIYVHVPGAWLSLFVYVTMAASGAVALVWRVKIAELICTQSAPIGAWFTGVALLTGMLWGKPMWGTYWVWDARLTSELILLFLYLGVIALHTAIPDRRKAARAASILAIVGVVNVPIIHYSVVWWNTLHQGATVTRFDAPAAHSSMLYPLLYMAVVFMLFYAVALLMHLRVAVVDYSSDANWLKKTLHVRGV